MKQWEVFVWSWFMFADCPFNKDGFFKQTAICGYVRNFHLHMKVLNYENVSTVNHAFLKEWGGFYGMTSGPFYFHGK